MIRILLIFCFALLVTTSSAYHDPRYIRDSDKYIYEVEISYKNGSTYQKIVPVRVSCSAYVFSILHYHTEPDNIEMIECNNIFTSSLTLWNRGWIDDAFRKYD